MDALGQSPSLVSHIKQITSFQRFPVGDMRSCPRHHSLLNLHTKVWKCLLLWTGIGSALQAELGGHCAEATAHVLFFPVHVPSKSGWAWGGTGCPLSLQSACYDGHQGRRKVSSFKQHRICLLIRALVGSASLDIDAILPVLCSSRCLCCFLINVK